MMRTISAFLLGALFAVGLVVSGMTRPDNVVAFLDITGAWDPRLAVVMVSAIGTYLPVYLWVRRRSAPVLAPAFHWPSKRVIDRQLVGGAVAFGVGWGLSGFCPGPALVAVAAGAPSALWFVVGFVGGMALFEAWKWLPTASIRTTQPSLVDG
jgi:uncharacterized membrane protein YedE/YeeE